MENEKLLFPIVELPMQMTEPGHRLLKSRLMWIGFSIAAGLRFMYQLGPHGPSPTLGGMPTRQVGIADAAVLSWPR
jgi:hypothetical protein